MVWYYICLLNCLSLVRLQLNNSSANLWAPLLFSSLVYNIIKCQRKFPLDDPVCLSPRHSGDFSCVRLSCYIGDNAQQESWNVPLSEEIEFLAAGGFQTHVHVVRFTALFVTFWSTLSCARKLNILHVHSRQITWEIFWMYMNYFVINCMHHTFWSITLRQGGFPIVIHNASFGTHKFTACVFGPLFKTQRASWNTFAYTVRRGMIVVQ